MDPAVIRRRLEWRGISVHAIARSLGVDPRHLRRVLSGERPGSRALLKSVADLAETMSGRRPQEDVARLINAAVHVFFVKRGKFDSEVWSGAPDDRPKSTRIS
jgi:transcriptional regulator with XRE-family HTH domain